MLAYAASAVYSLTPIITGDSGGYLRSGEEFTDPTGATGGGHPIGSWGGLSLAGDAFRAWPATLFYSLFPGGDGLLGNDGRITAQWVIAMLATVFVARAMTAPLGPHLQIAGRAFIYLFALTGTALTHVLTIGAEGIAYIIALVVVGLTVNLARRVRAAGWHRRDVASSTAALALAVMLSVIRITGVVVLIAVLGVLLVSLIRHGPIRSAVHRWVTIAGGVILLVGCGVYIQHVSANQSRAWGPASERVYRTLFAISPALNPLFSADVVAELPDDAPRCLREFNPAITDWNALGSTAIETCGPNGLAWIEENYLAVPVSYWRGNPDSAMTWAVQGAAQASSAWVFPGTRTVVPAIVNPVYYTTDATTGNNIALFWLAAWLVALAGVTSTIPAVRRRLRIRPRGSGVMVSLATGAWISFVLSYMDIWNSHPRKAWPFYFVAVVISAIAVLHLSREDQPGENQVADADARSM